MNKRDQIREGFRFAIDLAVLAFFGFCGVYALHLAIEGILGR